MSVSSARTWPATPASSARHSGRAGGFDFDAASDDPMAGWRSVERGRGWCRPNVFGTRRMYRSLLRGPDSTSVRRRRAAGCRAWFLTARSSPRLHLVGGSAAGPNPTAPGPRRDRPSRSQRQLSGASYAEKLDSRCRPQPSGRTTSCGPLLHLAPWSRGWRTCLYGFSALQLRCAWGLSILPAVLRRSLAHDEVEGALGRRTLSAERRQDGRT